MVFYKVKLRSFPKIRFAHTTRTDKYKNVISYRKNHLEISLDGAAIEVTDADRTYTRPGRCVSLIMPDMNIKTKAIEPGMQYYTSVAMEAEFDFERIEEEDPEKCRRIIEEAKDTLLLPLYMELGSQYACYESVLRKIAYYYPRQTAADCMEAVSEWIGLLGEIDRTFREQALGKAKQRITLYYSRKAQKYIEENYAEDLQVCSIAKKLGISANYLSSLFRRETGQTMREYIAQVRLSKARALLYEGVEPAEVAAQVGVASAWYLNQLFVRHFGVGIQKCLLVDKEISLYFKKPWDVEELSEDIYKP